MPFECQVSAGFIELGIVFTRTLGSDVVDVLPESALHLRAIKTDLFDDFRIARFVNTYLFVLQLKDAKFLVITNDVIIMTDSICTVIVLYKQT